MSRTRLARRAPRGLPPLPDDFPVTLRCETCGHRETRTLVEVRALMRESPAAAALCGCYAGLTPSAA
jgi:hypothetical protein